MGFPLQTRGLNQMLPELNRHIRAINKSNLDYRIEEHFTPESVWFDPKEYTFDRDPDYFKHGIMNNLHNHFEVLQGTVENISEYYTQADPYVKYSIRQLNNLCHEIESHVLSKVKHSRNPHWTLSLIHI